MAGVIDNSVTETGDEAAESATTETEDAKPDAYLIETGNILLDLIASEKRTADKSAKGLIQAL